MLIMLSPPTTFVNILLLGWGGGLMHHYIVYWKYLMGGITQLSTMANHRSLMIMTQNFRLITSNLKHTTDIIHYHLYNADEFSVL